MSPELQALGQAVLAALPKGTELELIVRLPSGGGVLIKNLPAALQEQRIVAAEVIPEPLLPASTDRRRRPREQKPDRRAQGERILGGRRRTVPRDTAPRTTPRGPGEASAAGEPKATDPAKRGGPGKGKQVCPACHEVCAAGLTVCPGLNCTHVFRLDRVAR